MTTTIYKSEAFCPKCGKPHTYVGDPIENIEYYICQCNKKKKKENLPMGWICPRCGRGNAPWKGHCDCVQELVVTITNHLPTDKELLEDVSKLFKEDLGE